MRLKHLTEDKLNARGKGKKEMKTHQPTGGRSNEGGMRIGEMERDILIAHGTSSFLKESFMKRSDGTSVLICNGCGTIPISNPRLKLYVCPMCDGPIKFSGDTKDTLELLLPIAKSRVTFSRVDIPYAYKLLEEELNTYANMYMRVITAKHARTFQPLEIVDIDSEESVEEESIEEAPKEAPTLMNVATNLVAEGSQAIQETLGLSSDTEEKAIAKANAVLEEPIPPPPEKTNETGTTIIIEGSAPAEAAPAPAEAVPAPAEAAPAPAEPVPAPAEAAPAPAPAAAGTEAAPPSLTLRPQSGGAAAVPRRRITWKGGAGETTPGPDEHVTVLKIG
jgi:hypothetical protein